MAEGAEVAAGDKPLCSNPTGMRWCGRGLMPGSAGAPWSPRRGEEDEEKINWIRVLPSSVFLLSSALVTSTRTIQRSQGPRASGETLRPAPRQQTFPTKESYAQEIKERKESDLVEATVGMLYCCTGNKDTTNMEINSSFRWRIAT